MTSPSHGSASRRPLAAFILSIAAAAGALTALPAQAQEMRFTISGGPGLFGGGGQRPAMSTKQLNSYSELLGFDETQKDAAKELLASYTTEFEKATKEHAEKMRQVSEEFRETRDDEVWQQLTPANEKLAKRSKELETTLLSDIKSLCTEAQSNQWPRFERARRRDRTIDRGSVSGESVDLFRIVKPLDLKGKVKADVDQQLDSYDMDLDKALIDRNRVMEDQTGGSLRPGRAQEFDLAAFEKQMKDMREAGAKVRDVNQRYARAIESVLPDDIKNRFQLDVKRASFPAVYRQSKTDRAFDAALKFDDLDAKQKEAVASLRQSYDTEAASLNDKWASAIMEEEKEGSGGAIAGAGGGVMMINFGGDDESKPSAQARKARRDADKKAFQNLESLLNEDQKTRLPKGGGDEQVEQGAAIVVPGR